MTYLMGIDLGSTSLKAVIYDLGGNVVARSSRPTEKRIPPDHPEWVIWEPEEIWGGAAAAAKEAISALKDPHDVKGVAVTGMGVDAVPMDEKGQWLYPFISWHDPRTVPQQQWWIDNIGNERTFKAGGWPAWAINTALRIRWIMEHEPEVHARTQKWLLIEDFVNFMLCGVQATDYSMASCTLLFDQQTQDWSDEILALAGIERRLLSDPRPSGTPIGEVTPAASEATGLPVGTPVVLGGHDHLCGALPVGAFRPGIVLNVTGTWEIVMTVVDKPGLTTNILDAGLVMQSHVARGMYAGWGGAVAAEMLEWYRKEYGFEAKTRADTGGGVDWDYLMQDAANAPAGANGVLFLPHMSGASSPISDSRSLGAFVGLTNRVRKGDMLRAVIEGLDYQLLDIVSTMEQEMSFKAQRLIAVGGAVRNKFWMQNKADMTGCPVEVPAVEEATPLGAAILAGIGVGLYRDEQDAYEHVCKPGETYVPDTTLTSQYAEWFKLHKALYPALQGLNHRLHEEFHS